MFKGPSSQLLSNDVQTFVLNGKSSEIHLCVGYLLKKVKVDLIIRNPPFLGLPYLTLGITTHSDGYTLKIHVDGIIKVN